MAIINQAFADGAHALARAIEVHARQAVTSTVSSALSSATGTISPSPTSSGTSIASSTSFTDSSTAPPSPSPTNNGGGNNNSGTSSPLLFFVALGFGVVFTNLWIIVGVKYCFRYNARNRQLRGLDENGEPINLDNMPARPHRRRREKKLMTMDEVNEKFPMMKYKSWVADRAKEGLPTAGGVSAIPSRANSVRSVEGVVPELPSKERHSATEERPDTSAASKPSDKSSDNTQDTTTDKAQPATENAASKPGSAGAGNEADLTQTRTAGSVMTKDLDRGTASDDEDDDDHINAAIPPELLTTAGDTCAICIDTLEDDDDIRGLTCGHAFHAVCLDPWLTNRRACCPLCKADYYTPKPRPPPADGSDPLSPSATNGADPARNNGRLNLPLAPQRTFAGWSFRSGSRANTNGRNADTRNDSRMQRSQRRGDQRRGQEVSQTQSTPQASRFARLRSRFPPFRADHVVDNARDGTQSQSTENATVSGANNAAVTPSQLEAGTRQSERPAAT